MLEIKFSSFEKLMRVIAYVRRFLSLRNKKGNQPRQAISKRTKGSQPKSKFVPLHPFLDDNGVLRVGGRLQFAELRFNQKHPLIIKKITSDRLYN